MSEALLTEWARLRDEVASVRRILAIPEGADVADRVTMVVHALADMLHPLAPWPPGWVPMPAEGIAALDLDAEGGCRAYVTPMPGTAAWCVCRRRSRKVTATGSARDVLTAIADCMARLEVSSG